MMVTVAQRKRLRKRHVVLTKTIATQEAIQEEIKALGDVVRLKLLNGEPIPLAIRVCECGFRAYEEEDLDHFHKGLSCAPEVIKLCTCCGKANKFTSNRHKVCIDCLGQSYEGLLVPEWVGKGTSCSVTLVGGEVRTYTSVTSAALDLGVSKTCLSRLVIGEWKQYKGMTAEVIPNNKTLEDLKALRFHKSISPNSSYLDEL